MSDKVNTLIEHLNSDDRSVREEAAIALGDIGDKRAVEPLIRLIEREPTIGFRAIESLGIIGDKKALGFLERIASEDEFLDGIARDAIREITNRNNSDIVDAEKHFEQAVEYEERDDNDQALKCYFLAINKHPQYAEAHFNIGNIYGTN